MLKSTSRPILLALVLTMTILMMVAGPVAGKSSRPVASTIPAVHGGNLNGKDLPDTTWLYGGPGTFEGKFENGISPDWGGWTHGDLTAHVENRWRVSTYNAENLNGHGPGNHALWCGDSTVVACSPSDTVGGVVPDMNDIAIWVYPADTSEPSTISITAVMNYDFADVGYDYLELICERASGSVVLGQWTGTAANDTLEVSTVIPAGDYGGPDGDQIVLRFRVRSDDLYDDQDCLGPSRGACQIDDIVVAKNGVILTSDDFESGLESSAWQPETPVGVGDFAALRNNLDDKDPCRSNPSYQVTFIDDGAVVPGTGGTSCLTWCYGPGGYIVNNTGGLLDWDPSGDWLLENRIISPPIAWPSGLNAAMFSFDVYRHETLCANCPGVFYEWAVRSTNSPLVSDLVNQPWLSDDVLWYGGPEYRRHDELISDLLVKEPRWVQLSLGVTHFPLSPSGPDGTPAPYFDNVALKAWTADGPHMVILEEDLFRDGSIESGAENAADLGANYCRVDVIRDIGPGSPAADPGDSLVASVIPRKGAALTGSPVLHWILKANGDFDTVRPSPPGPDGLVRGSVEGDQVYAGGVPLEGKFSFDLPDTGFFYPGDQIHYYITAEDKLDGVTGMSVWPPDTTQVLDFTALSLYEQAASIRALPTLHGPKNGVFARPSLLVVDAGGETGHTQRLLTALHELGFALGWDYDLFTVDNRTADHQQGLGGVIQGAVLDGYRSLLYDLGSGVSAVWLNHGNYALGDAQAIETWLGKLGKGLILCGNNAVTGLQQGAGGQGLLTALGVTLLDNDIAAVNGGARSLQITPMSGNGVLPDNAWWEVNCDCPGAPTMDALKAATGSSTLAFLDPLSAPNGSFSAVISRQDQVLANVLLTMPIDTERVLTPAHGYGDGVPMTGRARLLGELLAYINEHGSGYSAAPVPGIFSVDAHPNPFNPVVTLSYNLPRAGHLSLRIFDLRGRMVRSLLDERREAGAGQAVWDGRDEAGAWAPSGVYFYQVRSEDQVKVGKITMIK